MRDLLDKLCLICADVAEAAKDGSPIHPGAVRAVIASMLIEAGHRPMESLDTDEVRRACLKT